MYHEVSHPNRKEENEGGEEIALTLLVFLASESLKCKHGQWSCISRMYPLLWEIRISSIRVSRWWTRSLRVHSEVNGTGTNEKASPKWKTEWPMILVDNMIKKGQANRRQF